jgi:hypothetical protein
MIYPKMRNQIRTPRFNLKTKEISSRNSNGVLFLHLPKNPKTLLSLFSKKPTLWV